MAVEYNYTPEELMDMQNHITWTLAEYKEAKEIDEKQEALAKIEQIEDFLSRNPEQDRQEFREQIRLAKMVA